MPPTSSPPYRFGLLNKFGGENATRESTRRATFNELRYEISRPESTAPEKSSKGGGLNSKCYRGETRFRSRAAQNQIDTKTL